MLSTCRFDFDRSVGKIDGKLFIGNEELLRYSHVFMISEFDINMVEIQ